MNSSFLDALFRSLRTASIQFSQNSFKAFAQIINLINTEHVATLCLTSGLATVAAALVAWLLLIASNTIRNIFRRKRSIFISYQHARSSVADALGKNLVQIGFDVIKLPFLERPDHNELLDQFRSSIHSSDIVICVPGNKPSFVDHEVAMAYALRKPLIFCLDEHTNNRIPNTAKQGYPVFSIDRMIDAKGATSSTFLLFCSFVFLTPAATRRQLGYALETGLYMFLLVLFVDLLLSIFVSEIISRGAALTFLPLLGSSPLKIATPIELIFTINLLIFIFPYYVLRRNREFLRGQVRQSLGTRTFSELALPEALDGQLTRSQLREILYPHEPQAHHAAENIDKTSEALDCIRRYNLSPLPKRICSPKARAYEWFGFFACLLYIIVCSVWSAMLLSGAHFNYFAVALILTAIVSSVYLIRSIHRITSWRSRICMVLDRHFVGFATRDHVWIRIPWRLIRSVSDDVVDLSDGHDQHSVQKINIAYVTASQSVPKEVSIESVHGDLYGFSARELKSILDAFRILDEKSILLLGKTERPH